MTDIEQMTPQERFAATPRPLAFVRPRFTLQTARYVSYLLADEREAEFENLTEQRVAGAAEDSVEVTTIIANLRACIAAEKEVNKALIELVGPEREP